MSQKTILLAFFLFLAVLIPNMVSAEGEDVTISTSLYLDEATVKRGYTLEYEEMMLGILPGVLKEPTEVVLTKIVPQEGTPRLSFRFLNESAYTGKPFPIVLYFPEESIWQKTIMIKGSDWHELKTATDYTKMLVRAEVQSSEVEITLFENKKIMEIGAASWYKYKNCHCAASPDFPKGTKLKVTRVKTGKSVEVRVNDFGPERDKHPDRVIDLDIAAFEHIGNPRAGIIKVRVEKI